MHSNIMTERRPVDRRAVLTLAAAMFVIFGAPIIVSEMLRAPLASTGGSGR